MKDARRGKPVSDQLRHAFPCEPVFLTAPPERSSPEIGHIMPEHRECPTVCRNRVVGEVVASHDLPQPFPLLWNRLMHPELSLRLDVPKLLPHAVASGLPLEAPLEAAVQQMRGDLSNVEHTILFLSLAYFYRSTSSTRSYFCRSTSRCHKVGLSGRLCELSREFRRSNRHWLIA